MDGTAYLVALLFGVVAGLRALAAPAVVAWAVRLGRLDLTGSWLSDQLPATPGRTVPLQFDGRLITGTPSGAAIGGALLIGIAGR